MIIVDLNVLLYAVNSASAHHRSVSRWWHAAMNSDEPIGMPWLVISGFLRLSTRSGILPRPLSVAEALSVVESWLALDTVVVPTERDSHMSTLARLLREAGTGGNLVTDAHLAALAIGHGAALATCDQDFKRFAGLRLVSPLEE